MDTRDKTLAGVLETIRYTVNSSHATCHDVLPFVMCCVLYLMEKPAFKRAAARGAAKLVEYLDSTVPRAALESHLADTTWKAESAPGRATVTTF